MTDRVKLTYFASMGRGEVTRRLLLLAGVEFEDFCTSWTPWCRDHKKDTPFGQMPVLEIEGQTFCQSLAINRYIARKYGFAGKTLLEDARCDDICYTIYDLRQPLRWILWLWDKQPEKKAELRREYMERLPAWLSHLEEKLVANNGGDGYFVGDSMTYADITFAVLLHPRGYKNIADIDIDLSPYPKLAALVKRVESHPIIAERIKEIPDSWWL